MAGDKGGLANAPLETLTMLAREVRHRALDHCSVQPNRSWASVLARLRNEKRRRAAVVRISAAAACTLAVLSVPTLRHSTASIATKPVLTYQIEGGTVTEGGYLRGSGDAGIKLQFGEGTEFALLPGTRGRLRSVTPNGACIAIEHGTAFLHVTGARGASWQVEAGPFLVTVRGTVFTVSWDATTERLDLRIQQGLVSVGGPVTTGELWVKGGQRLEIDLPEKLTMITEAATEVPESQSVEDVGAIGGERRDVPLPEMLTHPKTSETRVIRHRWSHAVASGDWALILDDVDREGERKVLARASIDELSALADAARYGRRPELARAALLALRSRFPGSVLAMEAAFMLGRLAEAGEPDTTCALRWYDTYLKSLPTGTYASVALGRRMMVTKQEQGAPEADLIAKEYLQRFPTGPYAGAARALVLVPGHVEEDTAPPVGRNRRDAHTEGRR